MPLTKEKECFSVNSDSHAGTVCEVESKSCVNHMSVFCSCICRAFDNSAPSPIALREEQIRKHGDGTHRSERNIAESSEDMDEVKCQVLPDVPEGLPSDDIPVGLPLCVMELIAQSGAPNETAQLMKYAETIKELAKKGPGKAWLYFDEQFRHARQSMPISWAELHMELYVKSCTLNTTV